MELDEFADLADLHAEDEELSKVDLTGRLRFVSPTAEALHLLKQEVQTALLENQGETLLYLGEDVAGTDLSGLNEDELAQSVDTLSQIATVLRCTHSLLTEKELPGDKYRVCYLLRTKNDQCLDVRVAVCGNVDAGKSTMIGVLTRGSYDDGRGIVRKKVFVHKHEAETGRTSSISHQILGYGQDGKCINYDSIKPAGDKMHRPLVAWGDIVDRAYKIISFIDLAGHEKYLKTTVSGMTGGLPDYACLLIGANMGVTKMTKEHLGLALALRIPIIVVITKIDMAPDHILQQTLQDITRILKSKGVRKVPVPVRTKEEMFEALKGMQNHRIVPIFFISSVSGKNYDLINVFFNSVPPRLQWASLVDSPFEVLIDNNYFVTGVGTVVSGTVMSGTIAPGATVLLGPSGLGEFTPVMIKSIHARRVLVGSVSAGQSASFALKKVKRSTIRRGMVLAHPDLAPHATWIFKAEVIILYHSTTVLPGYQPVIQCMTVRQCAKIIQIEDRELLRTGDRATVTFRFMYSPEYLKAGMRLVIREGQCKGIGILSQVVFSPEEEQTLMAAEVATPQPTVATDSAAAAQ